MDGNRRRFTRIPFRIEAQISLSDQPSEWAAVQDLSIGGCRLAAATKAQPGEACTVKLHLAGNTSDLYVETDGEIVRQETDATAIRFTGITPDSLFLLQNIIRYNADDAEKIDDEINDHPGLE